MDKKAAEKKLYKNIILDKFSILILLLLYTAEKKIGSMIGNWEQIKCVPITAICFINNKKKFNKYSSVVQNS